MRYNCKLVPNRGAKRKVRVFLWLPKLKYAESTQLAPVYWVNPVTNRNESRLKPVYVKQWRWLERYERVEMYDDKWREENCSYWPKDESPEVETP